MPANTIQGRTSLRILVTGSDSLLAHCLRQIWSRNDDLVFCDSKQFDLTSRDCIAVQLREHRPQLLINTAAYNLVDRCEQERTRSWEVNAKGPEVVADLCATSRCKLIHFSSDYVFDGTRTTPYQEVDQPNPINHYGAGKLHGEGAVLRASPENLVLRTSWLFGPHPTQAKSFVHAVLRQSQAGAVLKVTTDQIAAPTYAPDLAGWVRELVETGASGLFHAVNDGGLSRYDWALSIIQSARKLGILKSQPTVEPVFTSHFGASMRRPAYTVLSNQKAAQYLGHSLGSWRTGLEKLLEMMLGVSC
jgi:dTDP-4-dehydrorhamnose reductase